MIAATNGFVSLENVVSSSRTWRVCFLCHPFNRCPFIDRWSGNWERSIQGVSFGWISHHTTIPVGHDRNVVGLLPGSLKVEYPICETLHQATMFINQFIVVKRVISRKANSGHWDGFIHLTNISGQGWWASFLKTWGKSWYIPTLCCIQGYSVWHTAE